jgi:hypothetical protein
MASERHAIHDRSQYGRGLGRALLQDCALRVAKAADMIGICGIVSTLSGQVEAFSLALGVGVAKEPMMLMVTLGDIRRLTE